MARAREAKRSLAGLARRTLAYWASVGILVLAACNYSFAGGTFPSHINTVYIEPFENQTERFDIEQELVRELTNELPGALGLQLAGEELADAVIRGSVVRYSDEAQNYASGRGGDISVLQHEVRVTVSIQLIDRVRNEILWESQGLAGTGTYQPDTQTDDAAFALALESIIQQVVDGAQSNW